MSGLRMTHSLCFFDGNIFASLPLAVSEMCLLTTSRVVNKPLWAATLDWNERK